MTKKTPTQVYLDSSDYSNLTTADFATEFELLKKLVDEGVIEVRYSNITVSELIHTEKKHQHYAIDRAKVLRALCGRKCLIYNDALLYHDCIGAFHPESSNLEFPSYAYDNRAHWYPTQEGLFRNFKAELAKDVTNRVRAEISRHPNPEEKKKLKKRLKSLIKNGNFTAEGVKVFDGMDSAITDKFAFLDTKKPSEMIRKHLQGKISYVKMQDYLLENGADPANLAEFTIDQVEDGLSKLQWLRKGGVSFIDHAAKLIFIADDIEDLQRKEGTYRSRKEIAKKYGLDFTSIRKSMLENCWSNFNDKFRKRNITHSNFVKFCDEAELGTFPSIDILVEIMTAYAEQLITKNRTKLLKSDFGDIAHAAYLPYVNIFRADKTMTHLFKNVADKYQTKVIRTLRELVSDLDKSVSNQ